MRLLALYARVTQFTPSKASPVPSAGGTYTTKRSTHSSASFFFKFACAGYGHTPPTSLRGLGPAPPLTAGTRSLKDFFHPQKRSATPASQPATPAAARAAPASSGRRRRSCLSGKCSSTYYAEFGKLVLCQLHTASFGSPKHRASLRLSPYSPFSTCVYLISLMHAP